MQKAIFVLFSCFRLDEPWWIQVQGAMLTAESDKCFDADLRHRVKMRGLY